MPERMNLQVSKLGSAENRFLTIGLLGGNRVGKSILINCLAGSEIASLSNRRSSLDHLQIYRYFETDPLPVVLPLAEELWREITQRCHIRQVLFCEFPGFDNLMGEHCEHILQFLKHLDVLIWVTSLERYADARFYEFLRLVHNEIQNVFFVLNKVDLLFQGQNLEKGYEQIASVTKHFQGYIRENYISEPLLYVISALQALNVDELASWNQFPMFRQKIMQQMNLE